MKQKPKQREEKKKLNVNKLKLNGGDIKTVQQENNNTAVADEVDSELLAKVLSNPEMRALLNSLAKTMK